MVTVKVCLKQRRSFVCLELWFVYLGLIGVGKTPVGVTGYPRGVKLVDLRSKGRTGRDTGTGPRRWVDEGRWVERDNRPETVPGKEGHPRNGKEKEGVSSLSESLSLIRRSLPGGFDSRMT